MCGSLEPDANAPGSPSPSTRSRRRRRYRGRSDRSRWNTTTIYSDDDRYRGLKNLRTALFMNPEDMRDRGLGEFDLVDITSFARDGSTRSVYGYRALAYDTPRGSVFGYMPELNVLCAIADHSEQSGQPLTKHLIVAVSPAAAGTAT